MSNTTKLSNNVVPGIGALKVKRSAASLPSTEPANDRLPPAPAAGTGATATSEGGKGGQPSLPLSNAAFLTGVIRDVADGASAAICSKPEDPTLGGWTAQAAGDVSLQCPANHNNYVNCSSFRVDESGAIEAKKDGVSAFHILVLDDVGSKVDRSLLDGFTPTWEIETSPGNSQWGIVLTVPITDPGTVKRLQDATVGAKLSDPGAGGMARWVRLPEAINGKAKYRNANGQPFRTRLVRWNPELTYSVDELVRALKLTLVPLSKPKSARTASARQLVGSNVYTPAPIENVIVTGLQGRGLYKRQIAPGKHEITCPWVGEHTDAIDGGAAYFEPDSEHPIGGFNCKHSHGDHYHIRQLLDFLGLKSAEATGKARIEIVPGEINAVRRAAEHALTELGGYYQRGGAVVVVRADPGTGDIATEMLNEPALTSALAEAADWYKFGQGSDRPIRTDPPAKNVMLLLRAQQYDTLPMLTGLARQPFFRSPTGALVSQPGYDAESGRYATFDAAQFQMPKPTVEAAEEALSRLNGLLDEFRFAAPEDRAAALCAMLTGAVRTTLPTAPAFNITPSTPGSGKSYLASTITPFAGPGTPLKISYPTRAEEASKAMLATFLSAPAAVVFDDMQTDWLPFGAVNRALTSDTITDRILGETRTVTVDTRSLIIGTGNNVGPVRDMSRRVVTIRLHHQVATPALEKYDGRPAELIAANRGRYVADALTIIAAYRAAGSPKTEVPDIASYGDWSDMCRQPLLWLGQPDPAGSLIMQLQADPDQETLGRLLRSWHAALGDKPVMLRELIHESVDYPDLEDALQDLPVLDREMINRNRLGWYFKRNANRVVDGFELQPAFSTKRNAWRVVAVNS